MRVPIANVRMGSFRAWFDLEDFGYQVFWEENDDFKTHIFKDEKSAKAFWHKEVIDRYNFHHCYCCN